MGSPRTRKRRKQRERRKALKSLRVGNVNTFITAGWMTSEAVEMLYADLAVFERHFK